MHHIPLPTVIYRSITLHTVYRSLSSPSEFLNGAAGNVSSWVCANPNSGGGCGGLGWEKVLVGSILGLYIIVYGQCQSYTPQLVTGPLRQTPPNKLTEVLWGSINTVLTIVMAAVAWGFSTQDDPSNMGALTPRHAPRSSAPQPLWRVTSFLRDTRAGDLSVRQLSATSPHAYSLPAPHRHNKPALPFGSSSAS